MIDSGKLSNKACNEAERQEIEDRGIAESQKLLTQGLSDKVLQMRAIEATEKLAQSPNTKAIVIGGGQDGLPLLLQQSQ